MKILHTGDWHLGKRLDRFERWDEQNAVLEEICQIAEKEQVDAVVIAGDLYDTFNPPIEATELFYKTLRKLCQNGQRPVIAIAGNHDSPVRIEAPDPLARVSGILFAGFPKSEIRATDLEHFSITQSAPGFVELRLKNGELLRLLLTPYANEHRLKRDLGTDDPEAAMREVLEEFWAESANEFCDKNGVNLLVAHLFMMKKGTNPPDEPEGEKPINHVGGAQAIFSENLPPNLQYVALGHLHRCHKVEGGPCPVVYSGAPLQYSFAEAGQKKYVTIVEAEAGQEAEWRKIELESGRELIRKTCESPEEAIDWLSEHQEAIVELYLKSDSYLLASDRKAIHQAHPRVLGPIPILEEEAYQRTNPVAHISLEADRESLFKQYFEHKMKEEANEELLELFREVAALEPEGGEG